MASALLTFRNCQGGHALVALYTDGAMPLHKVTCVPRGHALGYVRICLDISVEVPLTRRRYPDFSTS